MMVCLVGQSIPDLHIMWPPLTNHALKSTSMGQIWTFFSIPLFYTNCIQIEDMSNQAPPPLGQQLAGLLEPAQLMLWAMSRKYNAELTAFDLLCFLIPSSSGHFHTKSYYTFFLFYSFPICAIFSYSISRSTPLSTYAYRHKTSTLTWVPRFRRLILYLDTQCTHHTNTRNEI